MQFSGVPNCRPTRACRPAPTGFPPAKAVPGAVGDSNDCPFWWVKGSTTVYNGAIRERPDMTDEFEMSTSPRHGRIC